MLPLVINPEAEADLAEAQDWYDQRSPGLGDVFLHSAEAAFDRIRHFPEASAKVFGDLRLTLLRRFPCAIVYRVDDDQITVIAVYHTRRDPRGWQERAGDRP
jgi:plasmid stabilization system protein ParE